MPLTTFARENAEKLNLRLERLEMFDELMNGFIKAGQRQAIVFKVTKGGESIFEGTYGFNTKEYGLKMDTIFNVCSITKPVIAALILCLQEDGVIDITEPVWKYLPEFTGGGYEDIQLWQLLTHSSGLKDEEIREGINIYLKEEWGIAAPDDNTTKEEMEALDEVIKSKLQIPNETNGRLADIYYLLSLKVPMKHKPRSHMTYCSYGFNLLKDVIEAVTGESIDTYAERRLFGPLKMMDTAWKMPKMKWNKIIGRVDNAVSASWFNSEENYISDSGAGGLKTTVDDILKLANMILNKGSFDGVRVLSEASIRQMYINYNKGIQSNGDNEYANWSIGWNLHGNKIDDMGVLRTENTIDHTGFGGTKVFIDPDHDIAYACFAAETLFYTEPEFVNIHGRVTNLLASAIKEF